jgi:hypothetical protein
MIEHKRNNIGKVKDMGVIRKPPKEQLRARK